MESGGGGYTKMLVRIDSDRFGLLRNGSVRFGLTAQERGSASAETFQWENAGKHGEKRESMGNGILEEWNDGMLELWRGAEEKGEKEFLVLMGAHSCRRLPLGPG